MKSFVKFALTSVGLVLILIGVIGIFVLTQAQDFLTKAVDEVLTEAFGSSASVKLVSLNPANRTLVLHEFALANPEGFAPGDALRCARVELRLKPRTFLTDTPAIEMMDIEGADIHYRYELGRGTNIAALARTLSEKPVEDAPAFKVEKLRCRDAKIHFSANIIPGPDLALNVVTIRLENLENGAPITTAQAASIFLRSVLKETLTIKGLLGPVFAKIRGEVDEFSADDEAS
ncbi:MAG: hypothetical protein QGD90_09400 [Candidatus Hydrogenedentes bacterium]|nr:hypothetical protein [Candidatus Hydrogenedentota bacterium]